jgi:6-phospho-3-hexuloisomerase
MNEYGKLIVATLEEIQNALAQVDSMQCDRLIQRILKAAHIYTSGKGRSGLQMQAFAMRLMHLGHKVHFVGEVTTPGITAEDFLLVGSGSGKTASLIQYAQRAKQVGAGVGLITTDPQSAIASIADLVIEIPAPTPKAERSSGLKSLQPMGTLFEGSLGILCDVLILQLMNVENIDARQMFSRHANLE